MNREEIEDKITLVKQQIVEGDYQQAQYNCDEILSWLKQPTEDTSEYEITQMLQAVTISLVGTIKRRLGYTDTAIQSFNDALLIYQSIRHNEGILKILSNIGLCYKDKSDFFLAEEYLSRAYEMSVSQNDTFSVANISGNIGSIYDRMGDYTKALEKYKLSYEVALNINALSCAATATSNMGSIYRQLREWEKSIEYTQTAMNQCIQLHHKEGIARNSCGLGIAYFELGQKDLSQQYFQESLTLYKELNKLHDIIIIYNNLGKYCYLTGDYDAAYANFTDSIKLLSQFPEGNYSANAFGNMGILLSNKNYHKYDLKKAEDYLFISIDTLKKHNNKSALFENYLTLSSICAEQSRYQEAYEYYIKYHELEKEVLSEEAQKSAERFHYERKLLEIENERKLEAQRIEAEREKMQLTLEHKEKELENSINQIVEKNNFLNSISNDMRLAQSAKSVEKDEMLDELLQKIRRHISSGAVTAMIYDEIESVHGEFMKRIKAQYPALTAIEVKIAALLRMKLTSANIASLLFISQRTVELHRLRIRKKMELHKEDNLYMALTKY